MEKLVDSRGNVLAILIPDDINKRGVHFFSNPEWSQQIAYMQHPAGYTIQAHTHNKVERTIYYTQETIIMKSGKMVAYIYNDERVLLYTRILQKGDVLFLVSGGHSFETLDNTKFIEVKQGPYGGDNDKTRW